jgi:hypothetical protein
MTAARSINPKGSTRDAAGNEIRAPLWGARISWLPVAQLCGVVSTWGT